jgi:hypothetical protein
MELLPQEKDHPRALEDYFKIKLGELPQPVISRRWRRITFISTSLSRLKKLRINDLFMKALGEKLGLS